MTTKNKKIKYGKVNLPADEFEPKNCKQRITMMVDEEVIRAFKSRAKESGEGYQTLMNKALREASLKPSLEERIERVEKLLKRA